MNESELLAEVRARLVALAEGLEQRQARFEVEAASDNGRGYPERAGRFNGKADATEKDRTSVLEILDFLDSEGEACRFVLVEPGEADPRD